ncbi:endophilin-B1 isoform X6 [Bactrocera dorsalis]|uniref:Endophilin-B1 isoform X6 n=1 Tax=Bactrocera dorsalis TaxID=27457 RepID=A0A6I9V4U8_BACDO|nr:endophilin-B1 isoform X6 [Bactrocera dorsalis]
MNINLPNFNVKNLVKEAGSTLSRVVQLTEEKLGTTERTEYDNEFQNLAERADITKTWTEKIVRDTETVLIPNPQNRIEDFIFEKIEKTKPQRLSNLEHLALGMIEAGGDFGQDLPYGQALIKVGQAEQKLGQCERDFIASSGICFTQPLRKFLEGEMKTITKERGILETKRLDLDACKNRVKKARSMLGQQAAERDLRVAQAEFDRQSEITKVLLEGISTSQASHLRHLHAFVETQVRYYKHCMDAMNNLQRDLAKLRPAKPRLRINSEDVDGPPNTVMLSNIHATLNSNETHEVNESTTQILEQYDIEFDTSAITSVIFVTECSPVNPDYMYGKQGLLKGLVPRAFLEMLDDEGNDTYAGNNDY